MRRRRFSFPIPAQIALALLISLLVGIWALPIPLCESFLRARLSGIGIADANFEVTSVNPWRIEFQNLKSAAGVRFKHGEMAIEWSTPLSPRLKTITLTELELEMGGSSSHSMWRDLTQLVKERTVSEGDNGSRTKIKIPEILIRNASVTVISADDSVVTRLTTPSVSILPSLDSDGGGVYDSTQQRILLKTDLSVQNLHTRGSDVKNGLLSIAGRIERRDGQLHYRPQECDRVSLKGLKKDNISLSGPVNACVFAGNGKFAVAIDRDGRITLDMLVKPEPAVVDVNVSALPSFPVEIESGSFFIKFSDRPGGPPNESIAVKALNLVLPTAGISLEGVEISAMPRKGVVDPPDLLFDFGIHKLRHLGVPALLRPVAVEGKAEWSSKTLEVDGTFQQSARALNGMFHLRRDNETGEGEANFNISPLDFDDDGLVVGDVSPVTARYFARLAGQVRASGKMLFNDAWATPIQIAGTTRNFVVAMKRTPSSPAQKELTVDFGQSQLDGSLPPLSPEKGWATINVMGAGLRLGETELKGITGTINFLSFSPLTCPAEPDAGTSEIDNEYGLNTPIRNCLYESFAKDESESTKAVFGDAMDQFAGYLTRARASQSPK